MPSTTATLSPTPAMPPPSFWILSAPLDRDWSLARALMSMRWFSVSSTLSVRAIGPFVLYVLSPIFRNSTLLRRSLPSGPRTWRNPPLICLNVMPSTDPT